MQCEHCGREVPEGEYCALCGAHQTAGGQRRAGGRSRAFAANPSEHLYHPSIVSTLFPHLNPTRTLQLRWLLPTCALIIFLIGLARFAPLAIVLSALLMPALYLLYFYETELYGDEPLAVLAGTFVAGAVLGALMSLIFYQVILRQYRPLGGPASSYAVLIGVALPLLAQALMLVGPVALYLTRPRFDEVLDGLAFGAASGLGFAATQSIAYAWLLIIGPFQRTDPAYIWAMPTIRIALLVPLLNAATTGMVCAALWLRRDRHAEARSAGPIAALPVAIPLAALGQVVPALGSVLVGGLFASLIWYGATLAVLIVLLRQMLHVGLMERASALGHGGTQHCPHCGHLIGDVAFCPYCGIALRSTAKRSRRTVGGEEQAGA